MNNREQIDAIDRELKSLESHIARLKKNPEAVHEIDIDVLADRLKTLYTMALDLETAESIEVMPESATAPGSDAADLPEDDPKEVAETVPEPEIIPVPEPEIIPEPEPEIVPEPEPEIIPEPEPEIMPEPEPEIVPEPEPEIMPEPEPEIPPQPESENAPEPDPHNNPAPVPDKPKTTADLFSGHTTIADAFQQREDKSIAARAVPQAVDDLKKAIGINDKFLFINELFKGSPGEYNQAIDSLNAAGQMENAQERLDEYRVQYDWSGQSEAYHRLKKIVNAKYNGA